MKTLAGFTWEGGFDAAIEADLSAVQVQLHGEESLTDTQALLLRLYQLLLNMYRHLSTTRTACKTTCIAPSFGSTAAYLAL